IGAVVDRAEGKLRDQRIPRQIGVVAQSKKSAAAAACTTGFLPAKQRKVLPRKPHGDVRSFDCATKPGEVEG
ncbi:hypothetical protein, partial [Rhodovulum sulfidophilum]|uniref:hypothetical protein n=1 Tax=Rhodovulum sulfidophilum TaxID=35806 RepID=UPI001F42A6EC